MARAEFSGPSAKLGNDFHTIVIAFLVLAGLFVLLMGNVHAHCAIPQWLGGGCSFLGWTDTPVFYTRNGNYINGGSVILLVFGVALFVMAKITSASFKGAKLAAGFFGFLFVLLSITIYLFQFPWG